MILRILNIIIKLVNNMHKSSIIGFFLVSSLIFGSGNMMILQVAAAQDYYNDDKQYGDSSYSGYRDDNNNNYYPSKDYDNNKKYVCENGPFEGFFVSSVEFCKPADITVPTDFPTIQAAINASNPGDTIKVLPGIYTEQLTISKNLTIIGSGAKSTIIQAPDILNPSPVIPFPGRANIVEIFNELIVTMKGFTIAGPSGNICEGLAGVSIHGDATLEIDSSAIIGCLREGILVGLAEFIPRGPQVGHAVITKTDITDYRVVGIQTGGENTTLVISKSQVIAADAPEVVGQVGISGAIGPKVVIVDNKISGNICKNPECGPDFFTQVQGSGIFLFDVNQDSIIANNKVTNNDLGIAVAENSGCCKIENNKLSDNRFFGITIVDGEHTISNTKIFGGNVGVAAIAFSANTIATLDHVKIVGATIPVQEFPSGGFTAEVVILPNSFQNSKDGKPYFDSEEVIY
jgi:parallel beta-helix repeat protein